MEENQKRKNTKKQRQKEGKGKFEQCYAWIGDNKSWAQREYSLGLLQKNIILKQKATTSRLVINIVGRVTLLTKL